MKTMTTALLFAISSLLCACGGAESSDNADCFERDGQSVCFAGEPGGSMSCEEWAPGEFYCASEAGAEDVGSTQQAVMTKPPCFQGPYSSGCVGGSGGVGGMSACRDCSSCAGSTYTPADYCRNSCGICLDYLSDPETDPMYPSPGHITPP